MSKFTFEFFFRLSQDTVKSLERKFAKVEKNVQKTFMLRLLATMPTTSVLR